MNIKNIDVIDIQPTESIVLTFDINEISRSELNVFFEDLQSKYPNNTIIALPDKTSIRPADKDLLIKFRDMLNEVINNDNESN